MKKKSCGGVFIDSSLFEKLKPFIFLSVENVPIGIDSNESPTGYIDGIKLISFKCSNNKRNCIKCLQLKKAILQRFRRLSNNEYEKKKFENDFSLPFIHENLVHSIEKLQIQKKKLEKENRILFERVKEFEELGNKYPIFNTLMMNSKCFQKR